MWTKRRWLAFCHILFGLIILDLKRTLFLGLGDKAKTEFLLGLLLLHIKEAWPGQTPALHLLDSMVSSLCHRLVPVVIRNVRLDILVAIVLVPFCRSQYRAWRVEAGEYRTWSQPRRLLHCSCSR